MSLPLSQIEKTGFLLQLVVELRCRSYAVEIQGLDGVAGGDLMGERRWLSAVEDWNLRCNGKYGLKLHKNKLDVC